MLYTRRHPPGAQRARAIGLSAPPVRQGYSRLQKGRIAHSTEAGGYVGCMMRRGRKSDAHPVPGESVAYAMLRCIRTSRVSGCSWCRRTCMRLRERFSVASQLALCCRCMVDRARHKQRRRVAAVDDEAVFGGTEFGASGPSQDVADFLCVPVRPVRVGRGLRLRGGCGRLSAWGLRPAVRRLRRRPEHGSGRSGRRCPVGRDGWYHRERQDPSQPSTRSPPTPWVRICNPAMEVSSHCWPSSRAIPSSSRPARRVGAGHSRKSPRSRRQAGRCIPWTKGVARRTPLL